MIITMILNIIYDIIISYLSFLFIKCKELNSYINYNIFIINIIILIANIFRLIPTKYFPNNFAFIQALTLTLLDRLLITAITSQVLLLFLGS